MKQIVPVQKKYVIVDAYELATIIAESQFENEIVFVTDNILVKLPWEVLAEHRIVKTNIAGADMILAMHDGGGVKMTAIAAIAENPLNPSPKDFMRFVCEYLMQYKVFNVALVS